MGESGPHLLTEVLDWCNGHPHVGPLPDSGPMQMRRHADGSVTVEGNAPDVLAISTDLLAAAHPDYLSFTDGVLAMVVDPEPLHYRPLGPDSRNFAILFERVREA